MGGNVSHVGHLGGILVAVVALRQTFTDQFQSRGHQWNLRYQWKRFVMRNRLRAVRREQSQRRRSMRDDDDHPPTIH
jgi:hypothetical protein